jgi:hypothetical protein
VATIGDDRLLRALRAAGTAPAGGDADMLVVGEGALDKDSAEEVAERLRHGRNVLLLAQPASASRFLPVPAAMTDLRTEWGSTPFIFTTDAPGLPSIPTRTVLTTEILEATPDVVWNAHEGASFAAETIVGVLKPPPDPVVGTIVGRRPVSDGSLTVCQLPLTEAAAVCGALGVALLGELVAYAGGTGPASRPGLDR